MATFKTCWPKLEVCLVFRTFAEPFWTFNFEIWFFGRIVNLYHHAPDHAHNQAHRSLCLSTNMQHAHQPFCSLTIVIINHCAHQPSCLSTIVKYLYQYKPVLEGIYMIYLSLNCKCQLHYWASSREWWIEFSNIKKMVLYQK